MVVCRGKITTIISIISRGNATLEWGTNIFFNCEFSQMLCSNISISCNTIKYVQICG